MSRTLRIVAAIAGAFAVIVGVWGIAEHGGAADSPGDLQSAVLWTAIGILSLAVAAVTLAVAHLVEER